MRPKRCVLHFHSRLVGGKSLSTPYFSELPKGPTAYTKALLPERCAHWRIGVVVEAVAGVLPIGDTAEVYNVIPDIQEDWKLLRQESPLRIDSCGASIGEEGHATGSADFLHEASRDAFLAASLVREHVPRTAAGECLRHGVGHRVLLGIGQLPKFLVERFPSGTKRGTAFALASAGTMPPFCLWRLSLKAKPSLPAIPLRTEYRSPSGAHSEDI